MEKRIAAIRAKAENCKRQLAPDVADAVAWLRSEAAHLKKSKKPADKAKAEKFLTDAAAREQNPANYTQGALLPGPAAEVANLRRRKSELEAQLVRLE